MNRQAPALWLGLLLLAAGSACTNGGGLGSVGGGGGTPSPFPQSSAIGLAIPDRKIGVVNDPVWGPVGGYTQRKTSQVLAFPPGATVTLTNLSSVDSHTLNVIAQTQGPPPNWPASPSLSFSPSGNGVLGAGYASGVLNPGGSVKVKLSKPGIYLIGCAIHYVSNAMRDVIEVEAGATPGPTASPGPGGYAIKRTAKANDRATGQPRLIDQLGRSFTLTSLRGVPLAITFVSAHCTDACPLINAQFADATRRIAAAHLAAKLVTITLDPQNDSPRTMRELAKRFEADPRIWLLAGGSVADVETVMRAFGVVSQKGRDGYREAHTTFVYLFNADGSVAKTMLASSNLSDAIVEDVRSRDEGTQK